MNTIDHDQVRSRIADGHYDHDVETHLEHCGACADWADQLTTILDLAPSLYTDVAESDSSLADRIITVVRPRSSLRRSWFAAAAAGVALIIGAGAVLTRGSEQPDRVATAADALIASGEFRFVVEVNAAVAVPVNRLTPADPVTVDIEPLGRCSQSEEALTSPDRDDLADTLGTLILADPCSALELASSNLDPAVQDTANQLQAASTAWAELTEIPAAPDGSASDLEAASRQLARQEAERQTADIDSRVEQLEDAVRTAVSSTEELAAAESSGQPSSDLRPTALQDLQALSRLTQIGPPALPPATVDWALLSTGTWSTDQVTASGSADVAFGQSALATVPVPDTESDPVGAVRALLADPATLIEILESAPATVSDSVTWTVPDSAVDMPGLGEWRAIAYLADNGTIDRLVLTGSSDTVDVSITITFAR